MLAMTVEVGRFVEFPGDENQFAVLVDNREGTVQGRGSAASAVRQAAGQTSSREAARPLDKTTASRADDLPETRRSVRSTTAIRWRPTRKAATIDRQWLARMEPVRVRDRTPAGS